AQMPDTLLGLSTQEDKYWVNFKDVYGEDFESTQTPDPLARDGPDEANKLNPWIQPNTNLTDAYGSLDVNQDGLVNGVDYSYLTNNTPQIDEADLDGNGIPSEQADRDLAYLRLTGQIDHLPGYGNQLVGQEVIDWETNTSAIDLGDTVTHSPDHDCVQFSTTASLVDGNYDGNDVPEIYSYVQRNRFNKKMYMLKYYDKTTRIGHMMNVFFTRDGNSTDSTKWWAKEPQSDSMAPLTTIMGNLPENYQIVIQGIRDFQLPSNPNNPRAIPLLAWDKDGAGIHNIYTNPDLVTSMPQDIPTIEPTLLDVDNEQNNISTSYNLGQNYPNPSNSSTIIPYIIDKKGPVKLNILDMKGRRLETLVDEVQDPGKYSPKFNGSKYASGPYIYELIKSDGKTEYKIMTLIK
ncbi:T9SS type A sorting domain-containing protein, partial [Candidatus Woesearchaeota archaeon]|nr:T9SS type A sorting domain-containing protein [Candidatus Woesearchaeota archaeon]